MDGLIAKGSVQVSGLYFEDGDNIMRKVRVDLEGGFMHWQLVFRRKKMQIQFSCELCRRQQGGCIEAGGGTRVILR